MDLASVVAALPSVGVRVSGSAPNSSVQVDSSRACPPGLAGPEPSGTIHDLGQHFHGSRDEGDETITERENKYKCSLQALSEQKNISVNELASPNLPKFVE